MSEEKKSLPIYCLIPNMVTLTSLCLGMSSIKYALDGRWEISVALLVICGFLDGIDGSVARALNASSKFGAELDSLTDIVVFGVAPAILSYSWSLHNFPVKGVGWAVALLFSICVTLRLARFNVMEKEEESKGGRFFKGIPAPSGAGLSLVPIMLSFSLDINLFQDEPIFLMAYLMVIALFMVSEVPTISLKKVNIQPSMVVPLLLLVTIGVVSFITRPWIALPLFGLSYLLSIPVTVFLFFMDKNDK